MIFFNHLRAITSFNINLKRKTKRPHDRLSLSLFLDLYPRAHGLACEDINAAIRLLIIIIIIIITIIIIIIIMIIIIIIVFKY